MTKRVFILLLVIPTIFLLGLIIFKRAQPVAVSRSSYVFDVVRFWQSLNFQNIESTPDFKSQIQSIPLLVNCKISDTQRSQLFDAVYNTLVGLNDGSYESYRRFRTPTPSKLNPGIFNEKNREMLIKGAKPLLLAGERVPDDFEEYVRVMSTRMNEGHGLTNFWLGVCFTNASLSVDETNNLPPDLLKVAALKENAGFFRPPHFFVPDHDENNVLAEDGKMFFATLSMVTKHNPPDPPFRIYIRYFWDGKYRCWCPAEYVATFSAKRKRDLIW